MGRMLWLDTLDSFAKFWFIFTRGMPCIWTCDQPIFDSTHRTSSSWWTTMPAVSLQTRKPELLWTCSETPSSAHQKCLTSTQSYLEATCGLLLSTHTFCCQEFPHSTMRMKMRF